MKRELCIAVLALAALWTGGCVSRSVPERFPATSAASLKAREPRAAPATRALAEDPPLPGESTERWPGLRPSGDATEGRMHVHHGGHGNHGQGDAPVDHSGHEDSPGTPPPSATTDAAPTPAPAAAVYTCPMHPDMVSDREGRCPRCGMELERQP